jgi:hypothetical protein
VIDRLTKLSNQLDVIAEVLAIATEETDVEHRQHLLAVVGRAHHATRLDLQTVIDEENTRPQLRLITGGLGAALPVGALAATLARIRSHPVTVAAASTAAISLAVAGLLVLGMEDRHEYADRAPIGPVSTSTWSTTGTSGAPPATTPGASPPTPAPGGSEVDAGYSSPTETTVPASSVTSAPSSPTPTPAPTATAPPSPTWTPLPTTAPTDSQAGCLRLGLLSLADVDMCLLGAG